MAIKPNKVLLEYIEEHHGEDLKIKHNHQSRIKVDYTLFNDYFSQKTGSNFFDFNNYNKIISDVEKEINKNNTAKNWISVKIVDFPPNAQLHDLDSSFVGDMISTKAMIKNITESYPSLKKAVYECRGCMRLHEIEIKDDIVVEPSLCPECGGRSFRLNQELSDYRDYKHVKLEEPLEYRIGGTTREIKAYMQDYLASPQHILKPGDVVDVIGEFKVRKTDKSKKKNDFEFIMDLHNIEPVDNAFEDSRITDEDKKEIMQLSKDPQIYNRLVNSLAPEIVGYETVKEGLLLQMFEGCRPKDDVYKNEYMDRWTTHILLIGDPGIGKSQLVNALTKRSPRQIYINGSETTRAGLTTAAVKDELTGTWTLEAGAVILADTGILCIDEFDKLSKSTMKALNQPMEQLTVSSTKAGLVQTISARTSILAIANPKYSRFNKYKSYIEQINIPESTLSRFDLVFALEDNIEVEKDTELATALLSKDKLLDDIEIIDEELFKKYINYAKLECYPKLTDDAKKTLIDFYVETRQLAKDNNNSKPITARDLLALERLTIARAKCELRNEATVSNANHAIQIYTKSLETIGLTPETRGEIEHVCSDAEMAAINDVEKMIKAKMKELGTGRVSNEVLNEIKHEVGMLCYGLGLNKENILDIAIKNIKEEV